MSEHDDHEEQPQVGYAAMAATAVVTFLAVVLWVAGPAALAAWRYSRDGLTIYTGVLLGLAAAWTTIFVVAAARHRETRGWIVFGLFAWVLAIPFLARAITRTARRRGR